MKYVALLRGINVGGNRKVPMSELKSVFEKLGFTGVDTYINSGNVVFSSDSALNAFSISKTLYEHFGFEADILILSADKMIAIADAIPAGWTNDRPSTGKSGQKSDVVYLFNDVDKPGILEIIGYKPEVENMLYVPGAVLVNISRSNQSKCSLLKLVGTPAYKRMTIRNISTARKLADMVR